MDIKMQLKQAFTAVSSFYKKYEKYFSLASAVIYAALVLVVLYGKRHLVYAGFPVLTPWLIMLIFIYMVYRRFTKYLRLSGAGQGEKKPDGRISAKKYDDIFADDDQNGGYSDNYK